MKVRKAIIPAAGLGTRFLPATKAQPKEMLPIVDKPTIQYIVEEAIASGIEDIVIVTGRGKRAIEDHFDISYELEEKLALQGKEQTLAKVREISSLANIYYIRQKEPNGLGDAIRCANRFIGNEAFAVLLGDDIVTANRPCLSQLMEAFEQYQTSIIGVQKVAADAVTKYGIVAPLEQTLNPTRIFPIHSLIEKPKTEEAPSNIAIIGRYIFMPEIFSHLNVTTPGIGGELQLTDAINRLNEQERVLSCLVEGKRYDIGDKFGFIQATIEIAMERSDLREELVPYLHGLLEDVYKSGNGRGKL
ncbi:UTP--glucose-1-phosphate uridylyltransferase GalU [Virgibacillus sp. MG-45]|uniref:UTP--glucose-1-phosphate uridylyltransferase GalU n=1 Tax=Virgibacillus sp. MG-45 TaxID=3102791 RepID=UPI002ED80228